jgi:hypothetical protein
LWTQQAAMSYWMDQQSDLHLPIHFEWSPLIRAFPFYLPHNFLLILPLPKHVSNKVQIHVGIKLIIRKACLAQGISLVVSSKAVSRSSLLMFTIAQVYM